MTISDAANVFQSAICIALLAAVLLKWWADARLDAFRQEMFTVRDELFDYAASGKIAFDDPAYRLLRQMMNGLIRYGHQLTLFRFCITFVEIQLVGRDLKSKWSTKWETALANISSKKVQDDLKNFHEKSMALTATHFVFGSPVLISLLAVALLYLVLDRGIHNLKQIFYTAPKFTLSHILDTRMIENEAAAQAAA